MSIPPELTVNQSGCPVNYIDDQQQPYYMIKPKCGLLVGFTSGPENVHGVLEVTRGNRYALAQWFTQDIYHSED